MKYAIKGISEISKGTWKCVLEYWNGCRCGSEEMDIFVHQEKRPSRSVIIEEFLKFKVEHH